MTTVSLKQARQAREEVRSLMRNQPAYGGVGISSDPVSGYAVEINLSTELPSDFSLPTQVFGVPVRTKVTGVIRAAWSQSDD